MLAVVSDGVEAQVVEVPEPKPGSDELLVAVEAAGLNGVDRLGRPSGDGATRRGYEMAGTVVEAGSRTERFRVGDRVMGIVHAGQAELAVISENNAMPVPEAMPMEQAGGFSEVFCTADDAVISQCELRMGDRILVTGAAGGVGMAALQLARATGATAIASVRDEQKRAAVKELGFSASAPDEAYDLGPFDVILELVGGDNIRRDVESLASGGRLSLIGSSAGSRCEVDFRALGRSRGRIHASSLHRRPTEDRALVTRRVEHRVLPLVASGSVEVWMDSTFPLQEAPAAYRHFSEGGKLGKIVLVMG